jgi:hypothetical protein
VTRLPQALTRSHLGKLQAAERTCSGCHVDRPIGLYAAIIERLARKNAQATYATSMWRILLA